MLDKYYNKSLNDDIDMRMTKKASAFFCYFFSRPFCQSSVNSRSLARSFFFKPDPSISIYRSSAVNLKTTRFPVESFGFVLFQRRH